MVRVLRSLTFRLALIYLGLFTFSVAGLLALTYWASVLEPLWQVQDVVRTEAKALAALYDSAEPARLAERLAAREDTPAERLAFHVLEASDGTVRTANLPRWPRRSGDPWLRFELEEFEDGGS